MGGEFIAALVVLLNLLLVDGPDLSKLVLVVSVLNGGAVLAQALGRRLTLVRTCCRKEKETIRVVIYFYFISN